MARRNGPISVEEPFAKLLTFTSDRFTKDSYLWKEGKAIYISLITTRHKGKGYFKLLVSQIEELGYIVKVPNPLPRMQAILTKWGFVETWESDKQMPGEEFETWVRPKQKRSEEQT